jgi:hypothetical protein
MKKKFFLGVVLGLVIGLSAGCVVGVWLTFSIVVDNPMTRNARVAESDECTYLLYLYAPYPAAKRHLEKQAAVLEAVASEAHDSLERSSYLNDLALSRARLSKLERQNGRPQEADRLMDEAMLHLGASGSSWSESELAKFVDEIDVRIGERTEEIYANPPANGKPGEMPGSD